jgi:predicted ATPase
MHGCLVLEAYSVSHGKASPYLPVIELLKSYFQIQQQDDERARQEKIAGKVLILDRSLEDTLPYLFALLGIDDPHSNLVQMDPQIRRRRTCEALKKLFLRESLNQPLILIFEDLHWIDGETQGFLDVLSESVASAKVLLLVNYRPEYRQEWGQKTYYTQLRLAPFGKAEAEEFLTFLLGESGSPLPRGERARERVTEESLHTLKQLILDKTQGTPFFMEEVVQTLAEEGVLVGDRGSYRLTHYAPTLHIPTTVQGVLAARIDRLAPDEKALLQQLAVIGREFPLSVVRQVLPQSEDDLYRLLASLQRKEFLYEQPAFPEVEYIFKHALTQEVAYGTVLHERRKVLHEQTGQAIERLYASRLDEHHDKLAHHYQRSGNTEKAIEYLQKAGQQAVLRSANEEAVRHLTTALDLLHTLPDTPERARQELMLQVALGPLLMATQGFGDLAVERAYARAQELCQQLGDTSQLFLVLVGGCWGYLVRAQHKKARELAEQILDVALSHQDPALLLEAHCVLGLALFWSGELASAYGHAEEGIALYNPQQHHSLVFLYGNDPGVVCRDYAAFALWLLGYPDQALRALHAASALAQEVAHPHTLAWALIMDAVLFYLRHEYDQVQERADAVTLLSTEQGFPVWSALGALWQGRLLAEQGKEEGIAQIWQGLAAFEATGTVSSRTQHLATLAEACGKVGRVEDGLAIVVEALTMADKTGERVCEAELYRLKGTLTLQKFQVSGFKFQVENPHSAFRNPQLEAEACFLKAINIARQQQAKSWELRASVSLARLWQQQGKHAEAHQMLAEIYHWFTEGFDTKDLQEAKALLDELP